MGSNPALAIYFFFFLSKRNSKLNKNVMNWRGQIVPTVQLKSTKFRNHLIKCQLYATKQRSRGAGGAIAPTEFGGSLKGQSLISTYRSLAITASTSVFAKLSTALLRNLIHQFCNI